MVRRWSTVPMSLSYTTPCVLSPLPHPLPRSHVHLPRPRSAVGRHVPAADAEAVRRRARREAARAGGGRRRSRRRRHRVARVRRPRQAARRQAARHCGHQTRHFFGGDSRRSRGEHGRAGADEGGHGTHARGVAACASAGAVRGEESPAGRHPFVAAHGPLHARRPPAGAGE
jgi:hypothetical protein